MLLVYLELTETIIDRFGLKQIFFNYIFSSCIISGLVLFLMTIVNTTSPRLTIGAIMSLLTILVVSLAIECAHQIIFWMYISRAPFALTEPDAHHFVDGHH